MANKVLIGANPGGLLTRIKRSPFAFPLAALAALALLFISETAFQQSTASMNELGRMAQARSDIQLLLRRMIDAETGQRGYLLTGRKEYLDPYREAFDDVDHALKSLTAYYARDPARSETVKQLGLMVHRKLSELDTGIRLYDQGKRRAWEDLLLTDIGKESMDTVRRYAEELLAAEGRRVEQGRRDVHDTLLFNRVGVAAMTLISLAALLLYLRQTAALDAQAHAQQLAIADERDRLEREVARRTLQLRELAQHLQTAREDERSRLARELHDELGALLTAAKLDAARIKSRLGSTMPEVLERLVHLNETLNSGIALKRRIIEDLRPSSLSNLGLIPALEIQSREFRERSGVDVRCNLTPVRLKPAVELTIYRLVQEAFTNIAKYAKARHVELTLGPMGPQAAEVAVTDDGVGFDASLQSPTAHGLVGMRYRVEADGGRLTLQSAPGHGTRISAVLPALGDAAAGTSPPQPVERRA